MTALRWEQGTAAVWHAKLGGFSLFANSDKTTARWSVYDALVSPQPIADGPAQSLDEAKRTAEAWLRLHLHDLLRQLREP